MTKKKIIFLRSFYFDSLLFEKLDFKKYIDSKKIETEFWRSNNNIKISDFKVEEIFQKRLSKENELGDKLKKFSFVKNIKHREYRPFIRPTKVPFLITNSKQFSKLTRWKPKISFDQILKDTLNYWRQKII